ncbi:MAG: aldehyde dehydrogenase family protein, partial [Sporosarcina sp.]
MQTLSKEKVFNNLINNEWVESSSQETIKSISPLNKENVVGYVQSSNKEDLEKTVNAAYQAKKAWRKIGQAARGQFLFKVANILEENLEDIAETMTREMGKTLPEAKGETARGVAILRYYAGEGMRKDGDVIPSSDKD